MISFDNIKSGHIYKALDNSGYCIISTHERFLDDGVMTFLGKMIISYHPDYVNSSEHDLSITNSLVSRVSAGSDKFKHETQFEFFDIGPAEDFPEYFL